MSSERGTEVVGCDASIMRNVWEIREREYVQKLQQERKRQEKSALPIINKDWENRMAASIGGYKRPERKAKRVEIQNDENIWKSKKPTTPRTTPQTTPRTTTHGADSGISGKPGFQARGAPTTATNYKAKKGKDTILKGQHLLMFMNQGQPSTMVWGKAWKYNKCLPLPEEGFTASNWGQCWMFSTQQPGSEEGKPWPDEPNMLDLEGLHLWRKPEYAMVESEQLDSSHPSEEWQVSWTRSDIIKQQNKSANGENAKYGLFTSLVETHHHNEVLCSSEWNDSWQSTKPTDQQDSFTDPKEGLMNDGFDSKHDKAREMSSKWQDCWMLANQHGSKIPQHQALSPEWGSSWRTATKVKNDVKSSDHTQGSSGLNDHDQKFHHDEIIHVPRTRANKDLGQQLDRFEAFTEWNKSWQVIKNNSKPSQEIDKVLKTSPQLMETPVMEKVSEPRKVEQKPKVSYSDKPDPRYEQLKHDVIYKMRREFTDSKMLLLKHMEKVLPTSEWMYSWKLIKHRKSMKPFRQAEKELQTKVAASEWKRSWKFTCHPLNQKPDLWQQGWSTTPQVLDNWEKERKQGKRFRPNPLDPFRESEKGGDTKPNFSDWKDSWKLKCNPLNQKPELWQQGWVTARQIQENREREEERRQRRRFRINSLKHFRQYELGGEPNAHEWKGSWKCSCHPLNQKPDQWQQPWFTAPQIRVNLESRQSELACRDFPKNGPSEEQIWRESWRFSRHQQRSEPEQVKVTPGGSKAPSPHPHNVEEQKPFGSDWNQAWMVTETEFHHDKPSLMEWRDAWKWTINYTQHFTEQGPRDKWVDKSFEIQKQKKTVSLERAKAKMSRSFDNQMFRERYPEKYWRSSWSAIPCSHDESSEGQGGGAEGKQPILCEFGSKWGRSFRVANPMPHQEKQWVESNPNPAYYSVMWSKGKKVHDTFKFNVSSGHANFKHWANSHQFLHGTKTQSKGQMSQGDPRVIFTKNNKERKHLFSNMEKEKQPDKKLAGCHLLGKTQPRPKKSRGSSKKPNTEENTEDNLFEEWVESWKFLVRPQTLKKSSFKSLSGWVESWKFLLPPY